MKRVELLGDHVGRRSEGGVGRHQQQVHALLVPIVVVPSFVGSRIWGQHNASAVPQTEPGERQSGLRSADSCPRNRASSARGERSESALWPEHRGSGRLQPRASNRRMLADLTQPWPASYPWKFALHTRSPLVTTQVTAGTSRSRSRKVTPYQDQERKNNECYFGSTPLEPK